MSEGWRFFARYDITNDGYELFITRTDYHGKRFFLKPLAMDEHPVGLAPPVSPTIPAWSHTPETEPTDARGFLQAALDAAWEIGLRPKGFADHKNELTAVRDHLADMRKLAKVPGA